MNDYYPDENHGTTNLVSHFIDCNCMETARVGGGPCDEGATREDGIQTFKEHFTMGGSQFMDSNIKALIMLMESPKICLGRCLQCWLLL